jgi:hypothetical protein
LSQRAQFIADALRQRLVEVYARAESICPESFGAAQTDVARIRDCIIQKNHTRFNLSAGWSAAKTDCLSALRLLSAGESFAPEPAERPSNDFFEHLQSVTKLPDKRFEFLTGNYAWPLNFVLPSEQAVREHVLERLMVQLRAKIESSSVSAIKLDDLFLMLNFIAVSAVSTSDLRYIDALNYYFELVPAGSRSHQHGWLSVSYLSFYASALSSTSEWLAQCA